ncbi:MAG: sugar porter family MFS transporter [Bacteroidetes bacterium]|nr:sugar porter family MFS transporter [Bacteroidota bacterium]
MKKSRLIFWAVTSALAGFLFGFDTVVISGAEKQIQNLWSLSGTMHGWALSAALWGTVIGSLLGGFPTSRFGRKKTLISIGILYFVSAIGSAMANDVYTFIIARLVGGLGVGISTIAAPLFISEIAPAKDRGKLAGMFQFNIVFGILVAYFSNYLIGTFVTDAVAWRWMLGVEALPAIIYFAMTFTLPESPRWLITHAKKREEGANVFRMINPAMQEIEIEKLVNEVQNSVGKKEEKSRFWSKRLSVPILLAFLIAFFNQLSGINVILYFAPRLLDLAGIQDTLAASISLGVTNLIFTFVGLWLIDKLGRRMLLYIGSFGYIISLGICAVAFLSITEFKVVSTAIDLIGTSAKVIQIENKEGYRTAADEQIILADFVEAKKALVAASELKAYEGSKVIIPQSASTLDIKVIAEKAKIDSSNLLGSTSLIVLICIIAFIAAHAVGQGAVIWVFISEIFPNDHRAAGQALGSFTHWIFAALLTLVFPIAIKNFDAGFIFAFFCFMMVLQLVWVKFMMPETKGSSLEEIEHKLGVD